MLFWCSGFYENENSDNASSHSGKFNPFPSMMYMKPCVYISFEMSIHSILKCHHIAAAVLQWYDIYSFKRRTLQNSFIKSMKCVCVCVSSLNEFFPFHFDKMWHMLWLAKEMDGKIDNKRIEFYRNVCVRARASKSICILHSAKNISCGFFIYWLRAILFALTLFFLS